MPRRAERILMNKDKAIFNNLEMELEACASINAMEVVFPTWQEAAVAIAQLTPANLSAVQIQNGDGLIVGRYTDMVLQPGAWDVQSDGIHITVSLREKTAEEKRLDALEDTTDTLVMEALMGGETA